MLFGAKRRIIHISKVAICDLRAVSILLAVTFHLVIFLCLRIQLRQRAPCVHGQHLLFLGDVLTYSLIFHQKWTAGAKRQ